MQALPHVNRCGVVTESEAKNLHGPGFVRVTALFLGLIAGFGHGQFNGVEQIGHGRFLKKVVGVNRKKICLVH